MDEVSSGRVVGRFVQLSSKPPAVGDMRIAESTEAQVEKLEKQVKELEERVARLEELNENAGKYLQVAYDKLAQCEILLVELNKTVQPVYGPTEDLWNETDGDTKKDPSH